ncbi:amino acid ABC transporter permease [Paraburkholderia acidicola]|uniref:Amino acid ABC transporter permease n=1 Tax=Paraburkholderia acidicola TaxID=1912599 RepID=A0ABV1LUM0_9BURK
MSDGIVSSAFEWLDNTAGVNLSIFYDAFDRARFLEGAALTIKLSVLCIFLSIAIGIIGAALQASPFRLTNRLARAYVALFRNTPPVVQMFFFFFVLGGALRFHESDGHVFQFSNFFWATISLSFYYGSFNIEIFRAGLEAVPTQTVQAAEALGYRRLQILRHVFLPLAFRVSLPALGNNLVSLVKATSLAYAIAVPEITYVSSEIWSDHFNVAEMMIVLLVFYLAIIGLMVFSLRKLEAYLRIPGYHGGGTVT